MLTQKLIDTQKEIIENDVLDFMEPLYLHDRVSYSQDFRPGIKDREKVVSYFDYFCCGFSVLAVLRKNGCPRATRLMQKIRANLQYYQNHLEGQTDETGCQHPPIRRMILHIALACHRLGDAIDPQELEEYRQLILKSVPHIFKHADDFFPDLDPQSIRVNNDRFYANNHKAIFMQGVYWAGRVFNKPEWIAVTTNYAQCFLEGGHVDGYFEENANDLRQGGPSLVYTRLTAGALFDVLDGKTQAQQKFLTCGSFFRNFVCTYDLMIPIADERTNAVSLHRNYGLALHTLSPEGRGFVKNALSSTYDKAISSESLAVLYHELDNMICGDTAEAECERDGQSRIGLPLGVLRKHKFTAGISGIMALNRSIAPDSDYALDQQNMIYLHHQDYGVISSGYKSKKNPLFSTFRIGDDAWTVKTGSLQMGDSYACADLYYKTFNAHIRWDIADDAVLTLSVDCDQEITSTILCDNPELMTSSETPVPSTLHLFDPYTTNNIGDPVQALIFTWTKSLRIQFSIPD